MNWYVYCGGDPVNRVDPWGKRWEYFDSHLPESAQAEIDRLTEAYYDAGDSLDEQGRYVRDNIHNEAMRIRSMHLESKWLTYALKYSDGRIYEAEHLRRYPKQIGKGK